LNAFSVSTQDCAATSGRRERSSPSLSALCGHPRHCSATPGTATTSPALLERTGTGRHHACHCASYGSPLTTPSGRPTSDDRTANLYTTTTLEAAPVRAQVASRCPDWSKIRQDGRQLCGTAHHASTRRRIVRHTYKLLFPWPINGRAIRQPQGESGRRIAITHAFRLHHNIGTRLNQYLCVLETRPPLPPRL
jgi:hypothetical protein